jgi:CheY-like chemotaxis protein
MAPYVEQRNAGTLSILVVEDDPDTRELMVDVLGMTGEHTIMRASSAAEGLRLLRTNACDIVLTDIGLPDVSGLEMLDTAQHEGLLAKTMILVCSVCSAHEELRQEVVLAGACFIPKPPKPIAFEKLWDAICERMGIRPSRLTHPLVS